MQTGRASFTLPPDGKKEPVSSPFVGSILADDFRPHAARDPVRDVAAFLCSAVLFPVGQDRIKMSNENVR